jgi:EAL domain-containing protein (putative c-di-GMP-specific phosphodiesterase class I)
MQTTLQTPGPSAASRQRAHLFGPSGFFTAAPGRPEQTVDDLLRHALHVIRRHFAMDAAFIAEFRDGQRVFRYLEQAGDAYPLREGDADPLEDTYCQRIVDGRLPAVIPDTAACDEAAALPVTRALGVGSCLGVPIHLGDGRLYGTFCCFRDRADPTLNPRDAQTMRLFADFVGGVLQTHAVESAARQETEDRLRDVLERQAFTLVFQPIVSVAQRKLVGYEALTRFPDHPGISPEVWFREAEAAGVLAELETAVLRRALDELPSIPRQVYLSLNVSPTTILEGHLEPVLRGRPLRRIVLEVTEHASIGDYAALALQLEHLRHAGLRLAVDDAGAGFASFRHILKIRPDDIKLDISLIRKLDRDWSARALTAALIRFARETRSRIVAEGVETESVMQVLRELRVDKAQGFLIGRPGPLPALAPREALHA